VHELKRFRLFRLPILPPRFVCAITTLPNSLDQGWSFLNGAELDVAHGDHPVIELGIDIIYLFFNTSGLRQKNTSSITVANFSPRRIILRTSRMTNPATHSGGCKLGQYRSQPLGLWREGYRMLADAASFPSESKGLNFVGCMIWALAESDSQGYQYQSTTCDGQSSA
jgi:hypothetical protein